MNKEKLTIVGIHKAGIETRSNGQKIEGNAGILITEELMVILFEESLKMEAERFIIEDRAAIAKKLVRKADEELWQNGKS